MEYKVILNGDIWAETDFEYADPPMGIVYGKIVGLRSIIDYEFLKALATLKKAEIVSDYPEDKLISVRKIKELKVINRSGDVICEENILLEGMDADCYTITIRLPYPLYSEEFPHHVEDYENAFD